MINTYNESSLHKTLKSFYALQNEGSKTEVQISPYIVDIQTQTGNIIEIQTANLGALKEKCQFFIKNKKNITVVYPLVISKNIETKNLESGEIKKTKSPIHKTIYSVFRELTSLYKILLDKYFYLEILDVEITELRESFEIPVQSKNKNRRFKKNWLKTGKRLEGLRKKTLLHGKSSYKKLIPFKKNDIFTCKELFDTLKNQNKYLKIQDVKIMIWVFEKISLIEFVGKRGNSKLYALK